MGFFRSYKDCTQWKANMSYRQPNSSRASSMWLLTKRSSRSVNTWPPRTTLICRLGSIANRNSHMFYQIISHSQLLEYFISILSLSISCQSFRINAHTLDFWIINNSFNKALLTISKRLTILHSLIFTL